MSNYNGPPRPLRRRVHLWDVCTSQPERRDERYVEISEDGLYTDYDFRQDAFGDEGNCYIVTPMRLDLELESLGTKGDQILFSRIPSEQRGTQRVARTPLATRATETRPARAAARLGALPRSIAL